MTLGLRVRNEGLAERCEICHKADAIDPESGECLRCRDVVIPDDQLFLNLEDKPTSFSVPFGRMGGSKIISFLLATVFLNATAGFFGTLFLAGIVLVLTGGYRLLSERQEQSSPKTDLVINLLLVWCGAAASYFGAAHFLRLIGIIR